MIYHLIEYFKQIGIDIPGQGLFGYLSFRAIASFTAALLISIFAGKKIIGYMSLSKESDDAFELHNLAVLPEYRHNGFGKLLLDHAKDVVKASGGNVIKIGIIEESTVLKNWYIANGFVHTGTKKFDHLPFTSGYLEWIGG